MTSYLSSYTHSLDDFPTTFAFDSPAPSFEIMDPSVPPKSKTIGDSLIFLCPNDTLSRIANF